MIAGSSKDFAINEILFDTDCEWMEDREPRARVATGTLYPSGLSTAHRLLISDSDEESEAAHGAEKARLKYDGD